MGMQCELILGSVHFVCGRIHEADGHVAWVVRIDDGLDWVDGVAEVDDWFDGVDEVIRVTDRVDIYRVIGFS